MHAGGNGAQIGLGINAFEAAGLDERHDVVIAVTSLG
jgi:hypothetical protein